MKNVRVFVNVIMAVIIVGIFNILPIIATIHNFNHVNGFALFYKMIAAVVLFMSGVIMLSILAITAEKEPEVA